MGSPVDHLVFATRDINEGIGQMEELLSLPSVRGGSHPGLGTCNAHIALGPQCYLEIIGPDPNQPDFVGSRPFGIDGIDSAQLMNWAARRNGLSDFVQAVRAKGLNLSETFPLSRVTAEGDTLEWELSYPQDISSNPEGVNVVPFLIDWGKSPHPASHCKESAQLLQLELIHTYSERITHIADILELEVSISTGVEQKIRAQIKCPRGEIVLS